MMKSKLSLIKLEKLIKLQTIKNYNLIIKIKLKSNNKKIYIIYMKQINYI